MRNLLYVCVGLLVISGIVSFTFWRELRSERLASAGAAMQLPEPRNPASAPTQLPQPPSPSQPAEVEQPASGAVTAVPATRPDTTPAQAVVNSGLLASDPQAVAATRLELLKDPEYRAARLAQVRANQVERYPGLVAELGLSDNEATQLFDLLAEQQLGINMALNTLTASGADEQTTQAETARIQQAARAQRQEALVAMLGTERFRGWQQYQETLPQRTQATAQLTSLMAAAGQPIGSAKMQPVVSAMMAEQRRQMADLQPLMRGVSPTDTQAQVQARIQGEIISLQEASNRRVLDTAARHLNAFQLEALRASFEKDVARTREAIRLQQQGGPQ